MLCLAVDTSTPSLVTGIVDTEVGELAGATLTQCRAHNERLIPTIQDCLQQAGIEFSHIDAIVVGCGPGPFTGLRVGMATAAALGDALGISVHGVVSHDAIRARMTTEHAGAREVLVATDARRREVYWSRYSGTERIDGPQVQHPSELASLIEASELDLLNCPEGIELSIDVPRVDLTPTPLSLCSVAPLSTSSDTPPAPIVPLYLRRPDAVEPAPQPPSPAIPSLD